MKRRSIAFAGYEFSSDIQRGIYLYTKSLIHATKQLGHTTSIVSAAPSANGDESSLTHIYLSLAYPHTQGLGRSWKKLLKRYIEYRVLGRKKDLHVQNSNNIVTEDSMWFLQNVDEFINVPGIYRVLNIIDRLSFEKPLDLSLVEKHNADTLFLTSPLNVRSSSKRVKVVQTLHDLIPLNVVIREEAPSVFLKQVRALVEHSDRILSVSNFSRNQLLDIFPDAAPKIDVIYQPVPANNYLLNLSKLPQVQEAVLAKFGLVSGGYSLYVGAIEPRKNIHRMVEAYPIAAKGLGVPLVLAGSYDRSYVQQHGFGHIFNNPNKLDKSKNLMYLGYISEVEKLCLMRNARLFLFPTLFEGFGIPVLEAQTLGCPVITTNNSSLPEVVGDSAALIQDPYNVEEQASIVRQLLEDSDTCRRLSSAGLINSERFSKEQFAQNVGNMLNKLD